jgi:hypothetical protein
VRGNAPARPSSVAKGNGVSGSAIEKKAAWVKRVLRVQAIKSTFDPKQQAPYKKQTEQLQAALSEQLNLMQAQSNRVAAAGQSNQAIEARIAELISKNDDAIAPADYRECAIQMAPVVEEARRAAEWARSTADASVAAASFARMRAEYADLTAQLQLRLDRLSAAKLPADRVADLQVAVQRGFDAAIAPADDRVRVEAMASVLKQARDAVQKAEDHCVMMFAQRDLFLKRKAEAEAALANGAAALKLMSDPRWRDPLQKRYDAIAAKLQPALAVTAPDQWSTASGTLAFETPLLLKLTTEIAKTNRGARFLADGVKQAQALPNGPEGQMAKALGGDDFDKQLAKICGITEALQSPAGKKLSPGEMVAIYNYTTGDYKQMNGFLLGANLDAMSDGEKDQYLIKAEQAQKALQKLPAWNGGQTMRGEYVWPGWEQQYKVGNTFALRIFWSTSDTAGTLWGELAITVKGKQGRDVSAVSDKPLEREVLFPPGTKFRVRKRKDIKDKSGALMRSVIMVEEV